jgi:DNA repair photolyase
MDKVKSFNGKAIYNPSGKAGEYSYWACNIHRRCNNGCTYCYLNKGVLSKSLGAGTPELKSCFKNEDHAIEVFLKELRQNLSELQKHGLFFSFITDPMLPETIKTTELAIDIATDYGVPVKILTKRADWLNYLLPRLPINKHELYAFGFTLTGHDELEKGASTNQERIEAMKKLHDAGFKTWASIEPIIDFESSCTVIADSRKFCDLYKIGLMSGKVFNKKDIQVFVKDACDFLEALSESKIYFKDSLLKQAGILREDLPENCVSRDYNLFKT